MINIELGETYGLGSFEAAIATIETLRRRGFSDEEINVILDRSKKADEIKKREATKGVVIKGAKMPQLCAACPCAHFTQYRKDENYCQALTHRGKFIIEWDNDRRPSFCPLIPWEGGDENE